MSQYYRHRCTFSSEKERFGLWTRHPKLSIVVDCCSHVILAIRTGRGPCPDVHQMKDTLRGMPESVIIEKLLGDAGYDSEENHRHAQEDLGIKTVIPPLHGRPTSKPASGEYRRQMQNIFRRKPVVFGQRWQVEATFSMIKRNLGSALSARNYWSQCQQISLFSLTHNLMITV